MLVNFNTHLALPHLLCNLLLHGIGNIAANIRCRGFGGRIRILAIIADMLRVLAFSIESGLHFHLMLEHGGLHSVYVHIIFLPFFFCCIRTSFARSGG